MTTLYQKNMNRFDNTKIENIFDTINLCFIPLDERSPFYQKVQKYLNDNNLTIDQLDVYQG